MSNGQNNSNGGVPTMVFLLIFAFIVVMVFIGGGPRYVRGSSDGDNLISFKAGETNPATNRDNDDALDSHHAIDSDGGGVNRHKVSQFVDEDSVGSPARNRDNSLYIDKSAISPTSPHVINRDVACSANDSLNVSIERFWSAFDGVMIALREYCHQSLVITLPGTTGNNYLDRLVKINMRVWCDDKAGIPYAEIENLYKRDLVKNEKLLDNQYAVYKSIFLYTLYDKDAKTFLNLIHGTSVLSYLSDKITQCWGEIIPRSCNQGNAELSAQKVNNFVNLIRSSVAFEFVNEMRLSESDRMITAKNVTNTIINGQFSYLLRVLLRYWQYESVVKVHGECCQHILREQRDVMARTFFLIVQEKLKIESLKNMHPHMWIILADILQKYPLVVLEGTTENTMSSMIDAISTKLTTLEERFRYNVPDHRNDSTSVVSMLFGCTFLHDKEKSSRLCLVLSGDKVMSSDGTLHTQVTTDGAVQVFMKRYAASLGMSRWFLRKRKVIKVDAIAYYTFLARQRKDVDESETLYTLNLLDKPLPTLRSRMGEMHGMLSVFTGDRRISLLATGKCRVVYLKPHRAIIARQELTRVINTSNKLTANFNVVSGLMCDEPLVLKNTLIVSLLNTHGAKNNELTESKYLFIRANTLKLFASAFPPCLSEGGNEDKFINKLKNVTQMGIDNWARVYALGESLLERAIEFLTSKWNMLAKSDARYVRVNSDEDKLLLLWRFIKLCAITDLYSEYELIFGSLLYCDTPIVAEKSQTRVSELLIQSKLIPVRLVCLNFLLNQWWQVTDQDSRKKSRADQFAMKVLKYFDLRQEGLSDLLARRDIKLINDFYNCYPNDNENLRGFSSSDLYQSFLSHLTSIEHEVTLVQLVPLHGYANVFSMDSLRVDLDNGKSAPLLYNGESKFSVPIKDARARCRLTDGKTESLLLDLEVLSTDALFVSLIIKAVNIRSATLDDVKERDKIEYKVEVQIGHSVTPLDSAVKRSIVSFATRPMKTSSNSNRYNAMMNVSADTEKIKFVSMTSSLLAMNCSTRPRIPLSSSSNSCYYEVPSLDELELSRNDNEVTYREGVAITNNQPMHDTSLIPFSAEQSLQASLSAPTKLENNNNGRDGIYFVMNGERLSLLV